MASTAVAAGDDVVGQQRKGSTGGGSGTPPPLPPPAEQGLRCPRCDSPNTKFCYYNNYSLSQPRHFCKTCRRYWTKGGALRNVPVGGGCRKNKRLRSAASSSSRGLSLNLPSAGESIGAASDQHAARMGAAFPGGEFNGVVGNMLSGLHHSPPVVSQYLPFGEWPSGGDVNSGHAMNGSGAGNGAMASSTIASSIESLSFINQDLHWKLQQQRVATMFLGPPSSSSHSHARVDGSGHVSAAAQFGGGGTFLQMAGVSCMDAATSWFMDSSYALPSPPPATAAVGTTSSNINSGRSSGGAGDDNATSNNNNNCGSAIPSWGDISTFAMLP